MRASPEPTTRDLTRRVRPPTKTRSARGATLMELVVVMAIVGILASIAVTTYVLYIPYLRLNNESRKMAMDLLMARQLAIKENRIFYTCLNTGAELYSIFRMTGSSEDAAPCGGTGSEELYKGYVLDTNVDLKTACQAGATCTAFTRVYACPDGLSALTSACPDTSGTFPLTVTLGVTGSPRTRLISIRLSGAVTVQ